MHYYAGHWFPAKTGLVGIVHEAIDSLDGSRAGSIRLKTAMARARGEAANFHYDDSTGETFYAPPGKVSEARKALEKTKPENTLHYHADVGTFHARTGEVTKTLEDIRRQMAGSLQDAGQEISVPERCRMPIEFFTLDDKVEPEPYEWDDAGRAGNDYISGYISGMENLHGAARDAVRAKAERLSTLFNIYNDEGASDERNLRKRIKKDFKDEDRLDILAGKLGVSSSTVREYLTGIMESLPEPRIYRLPTLAKAAAAAAGIFLLVHPVDTHSSSEKFIAPTIADERVRENTERRDAELLTIYNMLLHPPASFMDRVSLYRPLLKEVLKRYNESADGVNSFPVDYLTLAAVTTQESTFDPFAIGLAGDRGMVQFIYTTAKRQGMRVQERGTRSLRRLVHKYENNRLRLITIEEAFDPITGLREGVKHLGRYKEVLDQIDGHNKPRPMGMTQYVRDVFSSMRYYEFADSRVEDDSLIAAHVPELLDSHDRLMRILRGEKEGRYVDFQRLIEELGEQKRMVKVAYSM